MSCAKTVAKQKVRPLGNRVLLKFSKPEESCKGILYPDSAKKKTEIAEVVAVGPGKVSSEGKLIEIALSVGDKVVIGKYANQQELPSDYIQECSKGCEGDFVLVSADDIAAVLS